MKRIPKSPVERRREQIAKQLQTLEGNKKSRRDFRSDELFENWKEKQEQKFRELNEESAILDNPFDYNEMPLAIVAIELGVTLDEVIQFIREDLIEPSFSGGYQAGCRITRDELGRAIDLGVDELRRLANKTPEETFQEAINSLCNDDVDGAERCLDRLERLGYVDPYWMVCYTAIRFVKGEYDDIYRELPIGLESFDRERDTSDVSAINALKQIIEPLEPKDHLAAVIRERILAVADGNKLKPYEERLAATRLRSFHPKWRRSRNVPCFSLPSS